MLQLPYLEGDVLEKQIVAQYCLTAPPSEGALIQ